MKKLTITVTEQNGNRKNITVELENELADWLSTQPEEVQRDFILFEYKARCVERKETHRTQSLDSSLDNGFDIADEGADVVKEAVKHRSEALHVHFLYGVQMSTRGIDFFQYTKKYCLRKKKKAK